MLSLTSIFVLIFVYADLTSSAEPKLPTKVFYDLDLTPGLFKQFIDKYNKKYDHVEYHRRFKIFKDNLNNFNNWNNIYSSAVFGIGPFADMTFGEFSSIYLGVFSNSTSNDAAVEYKPMGNAPDSLDWRQSNCVTEVKNQGHCGSCFVFSAIGNIEGQYAKQTGNLISLSEKQGLDCYSERGCCDVGGIPVEVMKSLADLGGSMREEDYPYEPVQGECRTDSSKIAVRVTGGNQLQCSSDEELKDALANYGPLAIAIDVTKKFQHFTGGVFVPDECDHVNHAVLLVGYGKDQEQPYWIIKNSWGTQWNAAEGGYVRMLRGEGGCNLCNEYTACATVAA